MRRSAQQGAHARLQFQHRERLGDVVVGAEFEAEHAVELGGACGQHQDRHLVASGAQRAAQVQPRQTGQAQVEHDGVEALLDRQRQAGRALAGDGHRGRQV
jgi:hypothetical protein